MKHISANTTGHILPPESGENSDTDFLVVCLIPINQKVNITVDGFRLKTNRTSNEIQ